LRPNTEGIRDAARLIERLGDEYSDCWESVKALSAALHAQPNEEMGKLWGSLRQVTLTTNLNALQYLKYFERLQQEMTHSLNRLADCKEILEESEVELEGATREMIKGNATAYRKVFEVFTSIVSEREFHASVLAISDELKIFGDIRSKFEKDKGAQLRECETPTWVKKPAMTWKRAVSKMIIFAYKRLKLKIDKASWYHATKLALEVPGGSKDRPMTPLERITAVVDGAVESAAREKATNMLDPMSPHQKIAEEIEVEPLDPAWINPDGGTAVQQHPLKFVPPGMSLGPLKYDQLVPAINGFCITSASREHPIALPVDRRIGFIQYGSMGEEELYGFASRECAHDFIKNPDGYLKRIAERTRDMPEYLELFNLHDHFPSVTGNRFKQIKLDGKMDDVMKGMDSELADRNPDVSEWGCRAIMNFGKVGEKSREALRDNNAVDMVLGAMVKHPMHYMTNKLAMQAVLECMVDDGICDQLRAKSMVKVAVACMNHHLGEGVRCAFSTMDSAVLGIASLGCGCCTVRVFRQKLERENAIEFHTFAPLEADTIRATNAVPLGLSLSYWLTL
jgi:hypothetical protein